MNPDGNSRVLYFNSTTIIALILSYSLHCEKRTFDKQWQSNHINEEEILSLCYCDCCCCCPTDRPLAIVFLLTRKKRRTRKRRRRRRNEKEKIQRDISTHKRLRENEREREREDSSSAAVARPTTSVNYYLLYYKRRIGKNCDKQTNDYEQFRSQPLLIGQLAREKEFSVVRRRKKAEREHKKGFSLLSLLSM